MIGLRLQPVGFLASLICFLLPWHSIEARQPLALFAFSGGTGKGCGAGFACPLRYNFEALQAKGGLNQIARALEAQGAQVTVHAYASDFVEHFSPDSGRMEPGFENALRDLDAILASSPQQPPRLVVLGSSQGVYWAMLLVLAHPELRFDYLIQSDGACRGFRLFLEHFQEMRASPGNNQGHDYLDGYLQRAGIDRYCYIDPKESVTSPTPSSADRIPDNVVYNLELHTPILAFPAGPPTGPSLNLPEDNVPNIRLGDGSTRDIFTHVTHRITHDQMLEANGPDTRWLVQQIGRLGLP